MGSHFQEILFGLLSTLKTLLCCLQNIHKELKRDLRISIVLTSSTLLPKKTKKSSKRREIHFECISCPFLFSSKVMSSCNVRALKMLHLPCIMCLLNIDNGLNIYRNNRLFLKKGFLKGRKMFFSYKTSKPVVPRHEINWFI